MEDTRGNKSKFKISYSYNVFDNSNAWIFTISFIRFIQYHFWMLCWLFFLVLIFLLLYWPKRKMVFVFWQLGDSFLGKWPWHLQIPDVQLINKKEKKIVTYSLITLMIQVHWFVEHLFWNYSLTMICPIQLLGPAIGFLAGPSSCMGQIMVRE